MRVQSPTSQNTADRPETPVVGHLVACPIDLRIDAAEHACESRFATQQKKGERVLWYHETQGPESAHSGADRRSDRDDLLRLRLGGTNLSSRLRVALARHHFAMLLFGFLVFQYAYNIGHLPKPVRNPAAIVTK